MIEVRGGCHCQAVRYVAQLPDAPVSALECNCSVCSMTGFLHLIVAHEDFELLSGREALTSYRFGSGAAEHRFCSACGVKSFYQPRSHPEAWSVAREDLEPATELVSAVDAAAQRLGLERS